MKILKNKINNSFFIILKRKPLYYGMLLLHTLLWTSLQLSMSTSVSGLLLYYLLLTTTLLPLHSTSHLLLLSTVPCSFFIDSAGSPSQTWSQISRYYSVMRSLWKSVLYFHLPFEVSSAAESENQQYSAKFRIWNLEFGIVQLTKK